MSKTYLFTTISLTGGGTERVAAVLPSKLADLGYDTHLIVYRKAEKEYPISDKLKVHYLGESWTTKNSVTRLQNNVMALKAMIQQIKPDVIVNLVGDMSLYQMSIAAASSGATFVSSVRNHPKKAYKSMKLGWIKNRIHLYLVKKSDVCYMQTQEQLDFFSRSVKEKSFVLSNPVDDSFLEAQYQKRDAVKKIVTLGRLNQQKNHKLLVDAFALLCARMPEEKELTLDIYGEGENKESLESQIKELGLQDRVHLCGRTTDPVKTLLEHDLFVLSSDYEGMPNALMEAMAVGIPCISTDCPTGPSDMITDKENGLLIPMRDKNVLADAMQYMIKHSEKAQGMGSRGKNFISRNYTAEVIAKKLVTKIDQKKRG